MDEKKVREALLADVICERDFPAVYSLNSITNAIKAAVEPLEKALEDHASNGHVQELANHLLNHDKKPSTYCCDWFEKRVDIVIHPNHCRVGYHVGVCDVVMDLLYCPNCGTKL